MHREFCESHEGRNDLFSMLDVEARIFRIGRSGHSRKSPEPAPRRSDFTYPPRVMVLVTPYGVDGE